MFDADKIRKAVLGKVEKPTEDASRWHLVPISCLIEYVEERAAIGQYEGGKTREAAERDALEQGAERYIVYELIG